MTADDLNTLHALASEWEQIAMRCDAVAERHKAKGSRLEYLEQKAFATARRSCADQLRRMAQEVLPLT